MKTQLTFLLIFSLTFYHSQQIVYKQEFKKCQKEFKKKICLSDDDKDDLLFYLDQCPKVGGSPKNFGCPLPDTDSDGVIDIDDACPDVAGQTENNGCPWLDTDGDGILDNIDACPTVPGITEKQGCPGRKTFSVEEIQLYQNKMLENQRPVDFSKMAYLILEIIDKEK